jgi:hypothetical protein
MTEFTDRNTRFALVRLRSARYCDGGCKARLGPREFAWRPRRGVGGVGGWKQDATLCGSCAVQRGAPFPA